MRNIVFFLFFIFYFSYTDTLLAEQLPTVSATGTDLVSTANIYENVVTSPTLNVTAGDKVMVIASFTCQSIGSGTVKRNIFYRITDGTNYSNEKLRVLQGQSGGDKGIGTQIFVFTIATSGSKTYTLQHKISNNKDTRSEATIVAMKLATTGTGSYPLNHDFKAITAAVSTTSTSFVPVSGLADGYVDLPVTSGLYIAASVDCYKVSTGNNADAGEWVIQYKQGDDGSWENISTTVARVMKTANDQGIVSLVALRENQPRGRYYFRLAHRVSAGATGVTIATNNTSMVGLALGYIHSSLGGRAFKTFLHTPSSQTNATTNWETESTNTFTAAGSQAFLHAQFSMSATAASNAPAFQYSSSATITQNIQYRALSASSDRGSGAAVGLMTGMSASSSYSANFQSKSTSSATLTINNIVFAGFQLTDSPAPGYWDGSFSRAWEVADNWADQTVPSASTHVYIPDVANDPIISGPTLGASKTLQIASGASLNIKENAKLTVAGVLSNKGSLLLQSSATGTGSLIFGSGTVNARVQRYLTQMKWHFIGMPVANETAGVFYFPGQSHVYLRTHVEATNSWDSYVVPTDTPLLLGRGYMCWVDDNVNQNETAEFEGILNNGNYTTGTGGFYGLQYTAAKGLNLLSNPYPSALKANVSTWTKNNVAPKVWVWSDAYGNYVFWGSGDDYGYGNFGTLTDGIIPAMQAFFVEAIGSNPSLTIPQSDRIHSSQAFYKRDEIPMTIRLDVLGNGYQDGMFVSFKASATDGYDAQYDVRKVYGLEHAPQLYSIISGEMLSINALPELLEYKRVSLGFECGISGVYTLGTSGMEGFDGQTTVYLEDTKEQALMNLSDHPSYTFTHHSGDAADRFLLHFGSPNAINESVNKEVRIFSFGDLVYINKPVEWKSNIRIYNMLGQEIDNKQFANETLSTLRITNGTGYYLVKLHINNTVLSEKIFIQ